MKFSTVSFWGGVGIELNISIVVDSFDGYSDLWGIFWDIFFKYWNSCTYSKYLIVNNKDFIHKNVKCIKTGNEVDWFTRTIAGLENVDGKYIIFLLEDYFFSKKIDETIITNIIEKMNKNNIYFYRLSIRPKQKKNCSFIKVKEGAEYPITLQPAIWRKDKMIEFLKELQKMGASSPWDFEEYINNGRLNLKSSNGFIEGIMFDSFDYLGYKNGVLRGKWFPDVYKYYKKNGIDMSRSERGKLTMYQIIKYKIIVFISTYFNVEIKNKMKHALDKLKIKTSL